MSKVFKALTILTIQEHIQKVIKWNTSLNQ